jgi:hypothetical protein
MTSVRCPRIWGAEGIEMEPLLDAQAFPGVCNATSNRPGELPMTIAAPIEAPLINSKSSFKSPCV